MQSVTQSHSLFVKKLRKKLGVRPNLGVRTPDLQWLRQYPGLQSVCSVTILRVTVDDADDDDYAHTRDRRDRQCEPAVLEPPRHDMT